MSAIKHVTDDTFESVVLRSGKTVLVDFWAAWCVPCRILSPVLEQIGEGHRREIDVVKINIDENLATARAHGVTSIPTMKVYKGAR